MPALAPSDDGSFAVLMVPSRKPPITDFVMEEEGWLVTEESVVPIAFLPPLPGLKHHQSLEMISTSSMNQHEYEENILSIGPAADRADDDIIFAVCTGDEDGETSRTFLMKRSSLQRSSPLNKFFNSSHYRFGCGTTLYFTNVPGAAFAIVKQYLDKGLDRYTKTLIVAELQSHYPKRCDRLQIYTRLHKCAGQLQLWHLQDMVLDVLNGEEGSLDLKMCVYLTGYIFADQNSFGHELRDWLAEHVKKYFDALYANPVVGKGNLTWNDLVATLCVGFQKAWADMVKAEASPLSIIAEDDDDREQLCTRVLQNLDDVDRERSEMRLRGGKASSPEITVNEIITTIDEGNEEGESSWEDVDHVQPIPKTPSNTNSDTKAREVLGAPTSGRISISNETSPRSSDLDLETSKAREVMGINSPTKGTIAGRRKNPKLTRAIRSFSSFKR